jgi:basic amino acid/polyamine antiporter, APA family
LTDAFGGGLDIYGVLQSAGLLFFAFAGYARIATMGEEVRDPQHTIPRVIVIALAVAVAVYAVVAVAVLLALGPDRLAPRGHHWPTQSTRAAGRGRCPSRCWVELSLRSGRCGH